MSNVFRPHWPGREGVDLVGFVSAVIVGLSTRTVLVKIKAAYGSFTLLFSSARQTSRSRLGRS